jgi:hypothetical protein
MEDLLQKIRAIHVTNEEIIERVESLSGVLYYEYRYKPKQAIDDEFILEEVTRTIKVQRLIQEYVFKGNLRTDVWDVFNDKPNWTCSTWADLKRLNKELHAIVDKFELLDKNNAKAKNELAKYLHNFEIIQTGLGELESKTISDKSRKAELQQRVNKMNAILIELKQEGVNAKILVSNFIDSIILNANHTNQLTAWYGTGWKLLYRASRDGWQGTDFHAKCDNKGETITVVKSNNNIFGGYLKASWVTVGYIHCPNASLFTLVNIYGIVPTKFNVSQPGSAGYGGHNYGPTFGHNSDLCIVSNSNAGSNSYSKFPDSYQDTTTRGNSLFAGTPYFQVTEMEVFFKPF